MPITLRGPRKAVRGKCERGRSGCGSHSAEGRILRGRHRRPCGESVNAGAEVQTQTGRVRKPSRAMGTRRGRLSAPWPRFHGVDRADVYIIIRVRACCCGECALNPPTSPPIPAEDLRSPPHSDTPLPSTSAPPRSPDARPQAARCIPRSPHNSFPAEGLRSPPHSDTPSPSTSAPPRSATLPPLPFRFGHKKTAPHSACAMPNVSVDRRCGRSFGLVSRALFAAVAGRWRVGVGLRPQPWALRSRRCGRVLRA